jgi:hypothetical protein
VPVIKKIAVPVPVAVPVYPKVYSKFYWIISNFNS